MTSVWIQRPASMRLAVRRLCLVIAVEAVLSVIGGLVAGWWFLGAAAVVGLSLVVRVRRLEPDVRAAMSAFVEGLGAADVPAPFWLAPATWLATPLTVLRQSIGRLGLDALVPLPLHARVLDGVLVVYDDTALEQEHQVPGWVFGRDSVVPVHELHGWDQAGGVIVVGSTSSASL